MFNLKYFLWSDRLRVNEFQLYLIICYFVGETFKVKKSSHSKRIAKQLKKENQKETLKENVENTKDIQKNGSPLQKEESQEDRDEKIRVSKN